MQTEYDVSAVMDATLMQLPISAYEEESPFVKTQEDTITERLKILQNFSFSPPQAPDTDPSGALVYIDTYKEIEYSGEKKIHASEGPMIGVPRDLRNCNALLDLSYAGLGAEGSMALAAALQVNSSIETLILSNNAITNSGAMAIVSAVVESRNVTEIDFSSNRIGAAEIIPGVTVSLNGGHVIKKLFHSGSIITKLSLRDNHLSDADLEILSESLADNITLQHLDLSYNKLGHLAAIELAKVLSRNADLREINLEWNSFGPSGSQILLSQGFLCNNTIKSFNLSACGLDDACASFVARIISENATEEIIIANNNISAAGADSIAKCIIASTSLVSLILDGNFLGDEGCCKLINASSNDTVTTLALLSLLHCGCSPATEARSRKLAPSNGLCVRISEGFSVIDP